MENENKLPWSGVLCTRHSAYPKWVIMLGHDVSFPMLQRRATMKDDEFNHLASHPLRNDIQIVPVAQQHNPIADCLNNEIWLASPTLYHEVITMLMDPENLCPNPGYGDFVQTIAWDYMDKCPIYHPDKVRAAKHVDRWYKRDHHKLDGMTFADFVYQVVTIVLEGLRN